MLRYVIGILMVMASATGWLGAQGVSGYEPVPVQEMRRAPVTMDMTIGYEHSLTHASNVNTEMTVNYVPREWVRASAGLHVATHNVYAFTVRGDFNWWLGERRRSCLTLRHQYLYSLYAADNLQDLNIALNAAYDHPYFYIALGGYARMFAPIAAGGRERGATLWEPGLTYDAEVRIFPREHVWNVGVQVTNMRMFLIERFYSPNFVLKGNYRFGGEGNDHLNLRLTAGFQPAGVLHITANYYSFYFNVGITCAI